jgi:hypothetical protein
MQTITPVTAECSVSRAKRGFTSRKRHRIGCRPASVAFASSQQSECSARSQVVVPMASTTASSLRPHTVMAEAKHDVAHIRSTQVGISGESLEEVMAPAPAFILLQNCRGFPAAIMDAMDLVWKKTSFRMLLDTPKCLRQSGRGADIHLDRPST